MSRLFVAGFVFAWCVASARADGLKHGDRPVELVVAAVGDAAVRMTLSPLDEAGKPRPPLPSAVLTEFPSTELLRVRDLAGPKEVAAGRVRLRITPAPLAVAAIGADGRAVQEFHFAADGSVSFATPAPVLGLGEGGGQFDRRGVVHRLVNGQVSPPHAPLATHGGTIVSPFLIGTDGWAIFLNRPFGEFDLTGGKGKFTPGSSPRIDPRVEKGKHEPFDLFVTLFREPAEAIAEYYRITGKPVMPPKWTLGYMQSHRTLAGPEEPMQIVKTFREKKLPLDTVIYLGTGYTSPEYGTGWNVGHGTFEFNPRPFPKPAESVDAIHAMNAKIVLHINAAPRNLTGTSVTEASDNPIHISNYWKRHKKLMDMGIDGWWPDDGDELPVESRISRHRCYFEGCLLDRPNVRPWSFHRNGFPGVQRYGGWIWSGDTQSRWATLAAHVPVGVNYSLSLTPFWGSDTGGFVPTRELTGELYARWFQFSAFNPQFRSHGRTWKLRLPWGWNTGETGPVETNNRPDPAELHNAAVEPICKQYLELRYRLLPYNYSLFREACDTGLPPMRALWLHYPNDPDAVKLGTEYLWGRDILVAPVVAKGATERKLYLPDGDWYDFWTNEKQAGKREITRKVDLATMPLYVRAGTVLPLDPVRQYTGEKATEPTTIRIYPGKDGSFILYEDDGNTLDYTKGKFNRTKFTWDDAAKKLTIEPDGVPGLPAAERTFVAELVGGGTAAAVKYGGKRVDVTLGK